MPNERNARAESRRLQQLRPGRVLEVAFGGLVLAVVAAVFALSCGVEDPAHGPLGEEQPAPPVKKVTTTELR